MAAAAASASAYAGNAMGLGSAAEGTSSQELVRQFVEFLEREEFGYPDRIAEVMASTQQRVLVSLDELRVYDEELCNSLLARPFEHIPALETALREIVMYRDPTYMAKLSSGGSMGEKELRRSAMDRSPRIHVGFVGSFGGAQVSPRGLTSELITRLVCVEGIITRCTSVRPKVARSVHFNRADKKFVSREYRDATDPYGLPTGSVYPTKTADGKRLETEFGLSTYKDHQTVTVQEMPERAPLGQLPRSVDIVLDGDLVDLVKPGDRVAISGVFRALAGRVSGGGSGKFKTVVLGNHVRLLKQQVARTPMTSRDIRNIRAVAKRPDVFDLLARSMAPSIYGHRYVKRALTLLLLGGMERNLANGTHIRGDINILMVGDPSTAKSQLLRFVLNTAPLAVNTTGRGSSGVGLTAAVSTDPETGDRRLEAGAMVLADRGVVCIDEFDKMSDADRVAIHEVMEQQTVTIAKAGIQASLNARCSVVAAANPVYGQYDPSISPQRNVNLPDSLLSRFDVLFIVLDTLDDKRDAQIAEHVLRLHRYQRPGFEGKPVPLDATAADDDDDEEVEREDGTSRVLVKFSPLLHSGAVEEAKADARARGRHVEASRVVELLDIEFLKKFISYAKARVRPTLTDAAREGIGAAYNQLRQRSEARAMPVTARTLETIIRLATGHAKARLSAVVEAEDVSEAVGILNYAFFSIEGEEAQSKASAAAREAAGTVARDSDSDSDSDDGDDGDEGDADAGAKAKRPRPRRAGGDEEAASLDGDALDASVPSSKAARGAAPAGRTTVRGRRRGAAQSSSASASVAAAAALGAGIESDGESDAEEAAPAAASSRAKRPAMSDADLSALTRAVNVVMRRAEGQAKLADVVRVLRIADRADREFVSDSHAVNTITEARLRQLTETVLENKLMLDDEGNLLSVV